MSNFLKDAVEKSVPAETKAPADNSLSAEAQALMKGYLAGAGSNILEHGILLGKGFAKGENFNDFLEKAEREQNAQKAADIIDRRDDMGTDYQKAQLQKMFEEAKKNGTEQELADAINAELEKRGCHCRIKVGGAFNMDDIGQMNQRGTTISLVDSDNPRVVIDNFTIGNRSNAL